jgi:hypothetical protein
VTITTCEAMTSALQHGRPLQPDMQGEELQARAGRKGEHARGARCASTIASAASTATISFKTTSPT